MDTDENYPITQVEQITKSPHDTRKYIGIALLISITIASIIFYNYVATIRESIRPCSDKKIYSSLTEAVHNKDTVCNLALESLDLSEVPPDVYTLTKLKMLSLKNNDFQTFPIGLARLQSLTVLDMSRNAFGTLPPEIEKMSNLRILYLDHTGLSQLPTSIQKLTKLEMISLSDNNFASEPEILKNFPRRIAINYLNNPFTKKSTEESKNSTASGSIEGVLGFPAGQIPMLDVYAFDSTDPEKFYSIETEVDQTAFVISGLPPSTYFVVAYTKEGGLRGAYTKMVSCGLSVDCVDHTMIEVPVTPGNVAKGVDVKDWYAPENTFPMKP